MSTCTVAQADERSVSKMCEEVELSDEARELLDDELQPKAYFDLLVRNGLEKDAIELMARWLPKREAVWWACLCAWSGCRPNPPKEVDAALEAAVRWVQDPSEENRYAARTHGKAAGSGTPAGVVALAAFNSAVSMSLPDLPKVPPPPGLTAKMIAGAVSLATNLGDPSGIADRRRQFLRLGLEVISGKNRWE